MKKSATSVALGFFLVAGVIAPVGLLVWGMEEFGTSLAASFFVLAAVPWSACLAVFVLKRPYIAPLLRRMLIFEGLGDPSQPHRVKLRECQDYIASVVESDHYYPRRYRGHEVWYWEHIPKWIMDMKDGGHDVKKCLDIGCGYGTLSVYCRRIFGCEVYAVDAFILPDQRIVLENDIAFFKHNIELDRFPWEGDAKFDVIVFTEVLEHLNMHPVPTLRRIRSLLSEDGRLFLSTPDAATWGKTTKYYSSLADIPVSKTGLEPVDDHVWQYSRNELLCVLDESGFSVEKMERSPGRSGRHFNLCLRRDPGFVPGQRVS